MKINKHLITNFFSLIFFSIEAQIPNYKTTNYNSVQISSTHNLFVLVDFLYDTSINSIAIDTSLIDFKGLDNRDINLLSLEKIFWDYTEKPPKNIDLDTIYLNNNRDLKISYWWTTREILTSFNQSLIKYEHISKGDSKGFLSYDIYFNQFYNPKSIKIYALNRTYKKYEEDFFIKLYYDEEQVLSSFDVYIVKSKKNKRVNEISDKNLKFVKKCTIVYR